MSKKPLRSSSGPVVLFGDSTTAPRKGVRIYADLLREEWSQSDPDLPVINAGVGGNSTALARQRFERDVLSQSPSLVVIQFGINDSAVDVWKDPPASRPRVERVDYRQNLESFIDAIQLGGGQVVLMTPNRLRWTPGMLKTYGKPPYLPDQEDGFNVLLDGYADTVRALASDRSVPLVDVHAAYREMTGAEVDALLLDGMHPNDQGHRLVYDLLRSKLPL